MTLLRKFTRNINIKHIFRTKVFRIFITFFIIYAFFIQDFGWNENSRLDLTRAIVEEHRFEIDNYHENTGDKAYFNGHYYSDKAPGVSFLAVPIYAFAHALSLNLFYKKILITAFASPLFTALTVIFLYKFFKEIFKDENSGLILAFIYGLSTLAFPYATAFISYPFAIFLLFVSFYLLFKVKENIKNVKEPFLISGIFAGLSIFVEYQSILFVIGIAIMTSFFTSKKNILKFYLGCLVGVSPLLLYNYLIFRNPLQLASYYLDPNFWPRPKELSVFQIWMNSLVPDLYIMVRMLIFPEKGLFIYNPILSLSLPGLYLMYKKYRLQTLTIMWFFMSTLWFFSKQGWWGGSFFGCRYLIMNIPFLMLPIYFVYKRSRFITIILAVVSFFLCFTGLQTRDDLFINLARKLGVLEGGLLWIPEYWTLMHSFQILGNPLIDHYLTLFFRSGPKIMIFYDKPIKYHYFWNLVPLLIVILFIWIDLLTSVHINICKKIKFRINVKQIYIILISFLLISLYFLSQPIYRLENDLIDFGKEEARRHFISGWSFDESWNGLDWVWAVGKSSILKVELPKKVYSIEVCISPPPSLDEPQVMKIYWNDVFVSEISTFSKEWHSIKIYKVEIPSEIVRIGVNTITFTFKYAKNYGSDNRELAMAFYYIKFNFSNNFS
jgi:hypothetical protein